MSDVELSDDLGKLWETLTSIFGFDDFHRGEDVVLEVLDESLLMKADKLKYKLGKNMMVDGQWEALIKWYEDKLLINTPPIMPKVYEEHPIAIIEVSKERVDEESEDEEKGKNDEVQRDEKTNTGQTAGRVDEQNAIIANTLKSVQDRLEQVCAKLDSVTNVLLKITKLQTNTGTFLMEAIKEVKKEVQVGRNEREDRIQNIEENMEKLLTWADDQDEKTGRGNKETGRAK
ncbi:uncharacterized protein LOC107045869 [Diachasma alloeum]|uniref:uncharacterized protein LOC107045869 n=1 Tax=Diachasma alloeum TaxID=454923 RepID=UPI000738383B|nr:uncharacterized protein LOC107045869 [Diachasma alloeum]